MAKYGYSLILIDNDLTKLTNMKLDLYRIFPSIQEERQFVDILNLNFTQWRDSTSMEYKIREVLTIEKDVPIFVNCMAFINEWRVCEDKLFHEIQFD